MSNDTENQSVNLGRRRLTQGGLASSVLLTTLVSKNALANVPYQCSVSGKISGNSSPHGPNQNPSGECNIGRTADEVKTTLVSDTRQFSTIFEKSIYAKQTGPTLTIDFSEIPGGDLATLYQVLAANNSNISTDDLDFCRAAVVLYENATIADRTIYPLIKSEVQGMFNKAINDLDYLGSSSAGIFTWTPNEVRSYFDLLYR